MSARMLGRLRAKVMVSGREAIRDLGGEATIIRAREIGKLPREPLAVGTVSHVAILFAADDVAKVEARRVDHRRAAAFRGRTGADRLPIHRDDRGGLVARRRGEAVRPDRQERGCRPLPLPPRPGEFARLEVHVRAFLDRAAAFAHLRGTLDEMVRSVALCELAMAPVEVG